MKESRRGKFLSIARRAEIRDSKHWLERHEILGRKKALAEYEFLEEFYAHEVRKSVEIAFGTARQEYEAARPGREEERAELFVAATEAATRANEAAARSAEVAASANETAARWGILAVAVAIAAFLASMVAHGLAVDTSAHDSRWRHEQQLAAERQEHFLKQIRDRLPPATTEPTDE